MDKKKPPKCPSCGNPLDVVYENIFETWYFDEKTGTYMENPEACDLEIRCPNCNCELHEVFPEGVCNYKQNHTAKR